MEALNQLVKGTFFRDRPFSSLYPEQYQAILAIMGKRDTFSISHQPRENQQIQEVPQR